MSKEEKEFIKEIDQIVLDGSSDQYISLQEIDRQTQLSGMSFYDAILNSRVTTDFSPKLKSRENRKK